MLRHPFFGIVEPEARPADQVAGQSSARVGGEASTTGRRTFFVQASAAIAAAVATLLGRSSQAQITSGGTISGGQSSTLGRGVGIRSYRRVTTQALGEEGGQVTTQAVGEEGGTVTTYAIGEEGGTVTTYAIGEEGSYGWPRYPSYPPRSQVTTYALGEEGSYYPPRRRPPPRYTTYAIGEEGAGWQYR